MDLDEQRFEQVVNAYYQPLYRFAMTLAGNSDDAADLTQESFRRFAVSQGGIRDMDHVKTWLFTTLYRKFLEGKRRIVRFPHLDIDDYSERLTAEPKTESSDESTVVTALHTLDETFRAPLALFYLQQHSYREIAEILDAPIGTIMSRISRGKAMLRSMLEDKTVISTSAKGRTS